MNIIINTSSTFKGGAEQVAVSFINECKNFSENNYAVVCCNNIASQLNFENFPDNFEFHELKNRPGSSAKNYFSVTSYLDELEQKFKPDVVISTGGHGYWKPKSAPVVGGFNIPHFVYPESDYFKRISYQRKINWWFLRKIHFYFYKRLDAIVVQTDDVRERLARVLGKKNNISTVSNTVNGLYLNSESFASKLPDRKPEEIRLLTLSAYYPHKNLEVINDVVNELEIKGIHKFRFVLTLPDENFKMLFGKRSNKMILNVGPVPIRECPSLYNECDFMFLPTLLECFSASYAEAMLMEKPILTSDLSFAHTVCKEAALYFNPTDPKDIAEKILFLANDDELQQSLKANGKHIISSLNTSAERAKRFLEICEETCKLKLK